MKTKLYQELEQVIKNLDVSKISEERKKVLQSLINFIQDKTNQNSSVLLNFICTHNSRRSHLAQIWAQTMAAYFGVKNVTCFSGGTEATAMFPVVAKTLKNSGFYVSKLSNVENSVYSIKYSDNSHPVIGFSKIYDHEFNPKSKFVSVMVCSEAEENCPFIANAEKRIAVTYQDPKAFDDTPQQAEKYLERSMQIASEMYYVFSIINNE